MKMTYTEMMQTAKQFYDTIDFKLFLQEEMLVSDLMHNIEEVYNNNEILPDVFEGYIFNFVNEYEFTEYLKKRYGWRVREEVIEHHYISPTTIP